MWQWHCYGYQNLLETCALLMIKSLFYPTWSRQFVEGCFKWLDFRDSKIKWLKKYSKENIQKLPLNKLISGIWIRRDEKWIVSHQPDISNAKSRSHLPRYRCFLCLSSFLTILIWSSFDRKFLCILYKQTSSKINKCHYPLNWWAMSSPT